MTNYPDLQRVQMQFTPVLAINVALNRNKAEYILEDFEGVLTDLMMLCIEKKNYKSLHRLVKIVRRTPWYSQQSIERIADVAEACYLGKGCTLTDETELEMPKFMSMRIMRACSSISQAVGFMAKQWAEGICLQDSEDKLRRLSCDLKNMRDYQYDLSIMQSDFKSNNGECQYVRQRWAAEEMVAQAIKAVEARLNHDEPEEE